MAAKKKKAAKKKVSTHTTAKPVAGEAEKVRFAADVDKKISMLSRARDRDMLKLCVYLSEAASSSAFRFIRTDAAPGGYNNLEDWLIARGFAIRTAYRYKTIGDWLLGLSDDMRAKALALGYSKVAVLAQASKSQVPSWGGSQGQQLIEYASGDGVTPQDIEAKLKGARSDKGKSKDKGGEFVTIKFRLPADLKDEYEELLGVGQRAEGLPEGADGEVIMCGLREASTNWYATTIDKAGGPEAALGIGGKEKADG